MAGGRRMSETNVVIADKVIAALLEKPCTTVELMERFNVKRDTLAFIMFNLSCTDPIYSDRDGDDEKRDRHNTTWYHMKGAYNEVKQR